MSACRLGEKKHRLCEQIGGRFYALCLVWDHYEAYCYYPDDPPAYRKGFYPDGGTALVLPNADLVNYRDKVVVQRGLRENTVTRVRAIDGDVVKPLGG